MKTCYVASLQDGERVDDVFLVTSKSVGKTQDGSTYVRLRLSDRTGTIDAIKWDANQSCYADLALDDYVHVRGTVRSYRDRPQLALDSFLRFAEHVDPTDFLPKCEGDIDEMFGRLRLIIDSVKEPSLAQILSYYFDDEAFVEKFKTAPAAQKIHHAYIGGLLEHTLSVAQGCEMMACRYPQVSRDLLVTGAILHDAGKVQELSWSRSIRYSDVGHLIGHIVTGCSMVEKAAETVSDMNELLRLELQHMILSHHGEKEWGSPKRPKSVHAIILHYIDDLDAKVDMMVKAIEQGKDDPKAVWTERHWVLDRPLLCRFPPSIGTDASNTISDHENDSDKGLPF